MSGGTWEKMAAYTNNEHPLLTYYGASIVNELDRKYTMIYPNDSTVDRTTTEKTLDEASAANYKQNTRIFGDAIRETSTAGTGNKSWYGDVSDFVGLNFPSSVRGGRWTVSAGAGLFSFYRATGISAFFDGFRAVLVGA